MIKYALNLSLVAAALLLFSQCQDSAHAHESGLSEEELCKPAKIESTNNFYDYTILSLSGKDTLRMSDFKGKFVLCVNVASECGYTPQYEGLEALYRKYKDTLVIIGFPCNQFGGQESGTADEIASFCKKNYGVSFPLSEKIEVKGENQHPIYSFLTSQAKNGLGDYEVAWNFNKFLINPEGKLLKYFPSKVKPLSEELTSLIK